MRILCILNSSMYICCVLVSSSPSVSRFFVSADLPRDVGDVVLAIRISSALSAESQLLSRLRSLFRSRPDLGRGFFEGDVDELVTFSSIFVTAFHSALRFGSVSADADVPASSPVSADVPADVPVDSPAPPPPPPPAPVSLEDAISAFIVSAAAEYDAPHQSVVSLTDLRLDFISYAIRMRWDAFHPVDFRAFNASLIARYDPKPFTSDGNLCVRFPFPASLDALVASFIAEHCDVPGAVPLPCSEFYARFLAYLRGPPGGAPPPSTPSRSSIRESVLRLGYTKARVRAPDFGFGNPVACYVGLSLRVRVASPP